MNTEQIIRTIFEALLITGAIIGGIYEEKLADLEQRIFKKWRVRK